jgi:hypothetical protein
LIDRLIHENAPDYFIGQPVVNCRKKMICMAGFSIATDITGVLGVVKPVISPKL